MQRQHAGRTPVLIDAARNWWLDRKDSRLVAERVARYAEADLLFVSFTKSGRTWLRVLLSNLYARHYGLPERELINGDSFHRLQPAVPRVHFAPDTRLPYPEFGPPQVHARPDQKVTFLLRDPRDVAVSMYFHVRHRASERELRRKRIPLQARRQEIDRFVLDEGYGMPRILRYFNRWVEDMARLPDSTVIRYESLVSDTRAEFSRLVAFIGFDVAPELVGEAVRFASFDNLQKKERDGFFNSDRLGQTTAGDESSGKVRQGQVGGYRQQLRPETVEELNRLIRRDLDPACGYR